ncbi:xylulokinase [Variovorax sp. PCZ-1]|uniref:xylulokinase n=1 Tax=Variovorax sp. PCZ-1 TaxID=2835533 RepID=UPI001BD0A980|nr:xylulokinase [Variovorax sp. PCZ-1]MBS7808473.1 xylulokinase [Variovorax sp. PCZ-1]
MYLGLDLGTSELKALLLSDQHKVIAPTGSPLSVQRPQALWSEQNPSDWWHALEAVMDQLHREYPQALAQLRGIGLSGQMHGATLLDGNDQVLHPCILWNDGRSGAQCKQLSQDIPELSQITGNLAMPGFTAPKLQWVRENEPELFARIKRVLLPKDWLRLQLTGEAVSEMSDAAGTLWLDVGRRDWSDHMLAATGLTRGHMPRLIEGSEVSASLKPALCQRWGLPESVLVAGGAGDNAASAVGMGLVRPGDGFVSLGTSGVIFVSTSAFEPNPRQALHAFCHALPARWHVMSVMLSAASAVTWATRLLGYASEAALLQEATSLSAQDQDRSPLFLPYLNGERSPHNNPHATGAWMNLRSSHSREHLAYAVAEGVGFGLLDGLRSIPTMNPPLQSLSLVGGGSRSEGWAQLLADILGIKLRVHQDSNNAGALGAARLAWLATGGTLNDVCTTPAVSKTFIPDAKRHSSLQVRHMQFGQLYQAQPQPTGLTY